MQEPLDTRYDHLQIEKEIYDRWEKSGYFNPDNLHGTENRKQKIGNKKRTKKKAAKNKFSDATPAPFTIIMPPPNANGSLHLGHAVFVTLQDLMIRYARMKGRKTLWLPGADHAGFETQVVFDKKLDKEGRNRFAMDREELWKEIWDFTQQNRKVMEEQLRRLGASCDWSREKFTLDPDIIKIVYGTFEHLYKDGLIQRDMGIVNWCPKHQTSLSDLEIKDEERVDHFYYLQYGPFVIGTARPETKFGDKYVVMHPDDTRYKIYTDGQKIQAEWINGPITATVIKDKVIDMNFGSGVMTITPWHDPVDFDIAQRHNLDKEQVIDERGRLLKIAEEFSGMKITEARQKIVEKLRFKGLLVKTDETYRHVVRTCYKCGTTIEPQLKKQWFVRTNSAPAFPKLKSKDEKISLRDSAMKAVKSGKIKFYPAHSKKIFLHWLTNLRDWNISRQIVWGIRIPAWFCATCGEPKINMPVKSKWFLVRHGETDWNKEKRTQGHADPQLNENGIEQSKKAAQSLKNKNIDLVISSDLRRARQTAEIIAQELGVEIIVDRNLRERNFGIAQGLTRVERDRLYGISEIYTYEGAPPGGESFKDLEERVWRSFRDHHAAHHHKNVVIVSHGGTIRTILKKIKDWDFSQMLEYTVENTGIAGFDLGEPCKKCKNDLFEQDTDVFDTWFSSGQWPFATLYKPSDFKTFYPTDVMETGHDILLFWVARMIMLGIYKTGDVPFRTVYLNGLVRDKDRQKMSKSKGNVIDPLGVAEIYGTDAVRMALVMGNTPGNDIAISEDKIRGYRNFATKVWNIARFVLLHSPQNNTEQTQRNTKEHTRAHRPLLSAKDKIFLKEAKTIKLEVGKHIERFEFHLAAEKAYHYVWHTFADQVIEHYKKRWPRDEMEAAKFRNKRARDKQETASRVLDIILEESLTMLHPFMPFITEAIYDKLQPGKMLMTKNWRE